jgi:hypothetical protein
MPVRSTSIPNELDIMAQDLGISISQATQLGIKVFAKGGIEGFKKEIRKEFREHLANKNDEITHLRKRIKHLHDQLEIYYRKEARQKLKEAGIKPARKGHKKGPGKK